MKTLFRFDIVVEFIRDKKLTSSEFCKLCNIDLSELTKMQTGDISFKFESLCKIATYIDVDLFDFFIPYPIPKMYDL